MKAPAPLLVTMTLAAALATPAPAQQTLADLTATPESTTELFLRSVRAIRWGAAAQLMHPDALDRFHTLVSVMVDVDTTGYVRDFLTQVDSAGFVALGPADVFDRAVGTMVDSMPGLMHAIYDHEDEVMGHVSEAGDTAHVVYRTTPRISGGVSEVQVMQLVRTTGGWRVRWGEELEVLDRALRGVLRGRMRPGEPLPRQPERDVEMVGGAHVPERVEAQTP